MSKIPLTDICKTMQITAGGGTAVVPITHRFRLITRGLRTLSSLLIRFINGLKAVSSIYAQLTSFHHEAHEENKTF
jgi:hypothetical protein